MGAESILVEYLGQPAWIAYSLYAFDLVLSAIAIWRIAKLQQAVWAVLMLLFRTAGILPTIYLIFFARWRKKKRKKEKS